MNILAIDPGAAEPGPACVYFERGSVARAVFSYYPDGAGLGLKAVVVECPEYQGARTQRARPQDLIALSFLGGVAAGYAAGAARRPVTAYTPSEWKGTEPKPTHHARLWAVLRADERAALGGAATGAAIERAVEAGALDRWGNPGVSYYPRAFKTHNILDAAALGCFHLGRLAKR